VTSYGRPLEPNVDDELTRKTGSTLALRSRDRQRDTWLALPDGAADRDFVQLNGAVRTAGDDVGAPRQHAFDAVITVTIARQRLLRSISANNRFKTTVLHCFTIDSTKHIYCIIFCLQRKRSETELTTSNEKHTRQKENKTEPSKDI